MSMHLTRRETLLCSLAAFSVLSGQVATAAESPAPAGPPQFETVSAFLLGGPVDPVLAQRYYAALSRRHHDLDAKLSALSVAVKRGGFEHVDDFAAARVGDDVRATAQLLVSAWYLGVVGSGADAELISYADAYMYRPTRGALVVPTYGAGPLAWGPKPEVTL